MKTSKIDKDQISIDAYEEKVTPEQRLQRMRENLKGHTCLNTWLDGEFFAMCIVPNEDLKKPPSKYIGIQFISGKTWNTAGKGKVFWYKNTHKLYCKTLIFDWRESYRHQVVVDGKNTLQEIRAITNISCIKEHNPLKIREKDPFYRRVKYEQSRSNKITWEDI